MTLQLTGKQARYLRGLGHSLKPLLQIGKSGLSPDFLRKVSENLERHELIKVKLLQTCPVDLNEAEQSLASHLDCAVAQKIGKTLLLYRPKQKEPEIQLPEAKQAER